MDRRYEMTPVARQYSDYVPENQGMMISYFYTLPVLLCIIGVIPTNVIGSHQQTVSTHMHDLKEIIPGILILMVHRTSTAVLVLLNRVDVPIRMPYGCYTDVLIRMPAKCCPE